VARGITIGKQAIFGGKRSLLINRGKMGIQFTQPNLKKKENSTTLCKGLSIN
jgi:hypothetical protein